MAILEFENEKTIEIIDAYVDKTILEIANLHDISFTQACGMNGHCSTCRIHVIGNLENVAPRNIIETNIAHKKGLPNEVRLACQTKVTGNIKVRRLLKDDVDTSIILSSDTLPYSSGQLKKVAILSCNLKFLISLETKLLPTEIIHILNRYYHIVSDLASQYGASVEYHIGSYSIFVIFGVEGAPKNIDLYSQEILVSKAIDLGLDLLVKLRANHEYIQHHYGVILASHPPLIVCFDTVIMGSLLHNKSIRLELVGNIIETIQRMHNMASLTQELLLISKQAYNLVSNHYTYKKKIQFSSKNKDSIIELYPVLSKNIPVLYNNKIEIIYNVISTLMKREQAPLFLRLLFHDVSDFDLKKQIGGLNASIRFPEIYGHPLNQGLHSAILVLYKWKSTLRLNYQIEVSFSDLIAISGAIAVEKCGGPHILVSLGRKDSVSVAVAGDQNNIPSFTIGFTELITTFRNMGLTLQDMVALMGSHTLGKASNIPFTEDLFHFNNTYFKKLLDRSIFKDPSTRLLKSDMLLIKKKETLKYVELYAHDQEVFFSDYREAYLKLINVGAIFD